MTLIKICGLSTPDTVDAAVDAGATHIGLVHFAPSPRHVELDQAAKLRARVPADIKVVLLTANADPLALGNAIDAVGPDVIQFHGGETTDWVRLVREKTGIEVWKAVGIREPASLERAGKWTDAADRVLYDAPAKALPGGNGEAFDWSLLAAHDHPMPWGLAGGLRPDNVADAIAATGAPLVDASSGLESEPGVKDIDKIVAFCEAAKG